MAAFFIVLVMAVVIGCSSPGLTEAPRATSTPPDAPPATATASPSPSTAPLLGDFNVLPPGTYAIDYLPQAHITVTVPAGWTNWQGWAILKGGADPPNGSGLGFKLADNAYADSCHWQGTLLEPPLGPSVDDLVTALAMQPARKPTTPVGITVDGYAGKAIDFTVPIDLDFATCDERDYRSYTTSNWNGTDHGIRYHQGPGQTDRNWILDVESHRLVINASFFPGTSPADLAELEAMVESVRIDP